jgi:hypothetical protein
VGNPRPNCVADDVSLTPASRSRQPRTNTRKCGDQPAHQSLLNRRLDGSVSGPAQSLYPAWPCSCTGIAHPRQGSLTTNIRVRVAPGRALGLAAPRATRPVLATSDRKPRKSSALRNRATRRPGAFATGADLWCYPGGETGQVDCRYAAYEPPSRPLKTLQQRKIKTRRNR